MEELRKSSSLSAEDKTTLIAAATVLRKLEAAHPYDVLFDSCDQYYVTIRGVADVLDSLGDHI